MKAASKRSLEFNLILFAGRITHLGSTGVETEESLCMILQEREVRVHLNWLMRKLRHAVTTQLNFTMINVALRSVRFGMTQAGKV
jgi:hypothetical protein